jgi:hypothetical protein
MRKLFTLLAFMALSYSAPAQYIYHNAADIAEMQRRATALPTGPFVSLADAGTNSPADWQRIKQEADAFVAAPLVYGNTDASNLTIWSPGYPGIAGVGDYYPRWQGHGQVSAGLAYLVTKQKKYASAVKTAIQAQMAVGGTTTLANWPTPTDVNQNPTYEQAAQESIFYTRLCLAFDYTKNQWSATEQAAFKAWIKPSAWYVANRIQTELSRSLPKRLAADWSVRTYYAAPNGVTNAGWTDPIYEKDNKNLYPQFGGWYYTHLNSDGTPGYKVSRHAQDYNNRTWMKAAFIYTAGRVCADTMLVWHAKCIFKETVAFASWPGGEISDWCRNGDYGIWQQGYVYSFWFYEFATMLADGEARRGKYDIYNFATSDGSHGTQCGANVPPKTLFTILDRVRDCSNGARPVYAGTVAPANRIDDFSEANQWFVPFSYILATSGKWKADTSYAGVAYRTNPKCLPYPTKGFVPAGKVGLIWCGSGLTWSGYNFEFGKMEKVTTYPK